MLKDELLQQPILEGFTEDELRILEKKFISKKYASNEVIVPEGDTAADLFLLAEGAANVSRWDEQYKMQIPIVKLVKGEAFGKMSFMEGSPSASTVTAFAETEILRLARDSFDISSLEEQKVLNKLLINIGKDNIKRLREANKINENNLRKHLHTFQMRQDAGTFLIYQILILSICAFLGVFFGGEIRLRQYVPWIVGVIPAFFLIKKRGLSPARFGLNLYHWPSVVLFALAISAVAVGFLALVHYAFEIHPTEKWVLFWRHHRLAVPHFSFTVNLILYLLYAFSEEFIARGVMQTSLREFLEDTAGLKTVWINAFLVSLLHLPFGYIVAINSFFSSLFLGAVYLKQKTILGVFIIHFILGFYILFV